MASEKQIEANRRNALKSTGPRTEAGKQRSAINAARHHLTGQVSTMTEPDREAWDNFMRALLKDLKPVGALEMQLAVSIGYDRWRLNRAAAIEENLFAMAIGNYGGRECYTHPQIDDAMTTARYYSREAKTFQLLTLYEQRLNRNLHKNLRELRALQGARANQPVPNQPNDEPTPRAMAAGGSPMPNPLPEHADSVELVEPAAQAVSPQPVDYEPVPISNGFVFSNRKLTRSERRRLRREARSTHQNSLAA
jgi:hypothetical protein